MEDEDPAEAWGVEGYSSEQRSGKMSWILSKGLSVGKKILVTGFVISSAPLVLPPLVVISVIGLACSIPSGLLLASYACTDKLMSKLLPGTKPPPFLLDYGTMSTDDKEFENDENEGDYYLGLKGDIDHTGKEEEEMLEDTVQEKAIVRDENEQGGVGKDKHELIKDVNEIAEENVYQQDEMEEEPAIQIEMKIEGVGEEEMKEPGGDRPVDEVNAVVVDLTVEEISGGIVQKGEFEVTDVVVELCQNIHDIEEDEELVRETRGLLEKIREEDMTYTREEAKQSLKKLPGDAEEKKPIESVEGLLAKRDADASLEAQNVGRTTEEEQKAKVEKPALLQGGRGQDNITNDVARDYQLEKAKEIVISTNADAREIAGESGFDLYDNKRDVSQHYSGTNKDNHGGTYIKSLGILPSCKIVINLNTCIKFTDASAENMKSSSYAGFVTTDNKKVPVSARQRERNRTAGISAKEDSSMASNKVRIYSVFS